MALAQRLIDVTFALGQSQPGSGAGPSTFVESGTNQVTLSGLRVAAKVVKAGGPAMSTLELRVYGMTLSLMNQLSTLGMIATHVYKNSVLVEAGDADSGMATVFIGTITNAWADFQAAPDVAFHVEAHTGLLENVTPAKPSSYTGATSVATIMSSLATQMGLTFENGGVTTVLANPYFYGSPRAQALACARAANCEWIIDDGVLAIWPKGSARNGEAPLISPGTGMRGYPAYTSKGIAVETLYNPSVGYGKNIVVQSSLTPANGTWVTYSLDHDLESMVFDGQWFTRIEAARPGFGPVIQ